MAERLSKFIKHDFPNRFCWSGVRVTSQTSTYLHNIIFSVRNPLSGNYWWGLISHPAFTFPQSLLRFSCSMAQEVCISCSGDGKYKKLHFFLRSNSGKKQEFIIPFKNCTCSNIIRGLYYSTHPGRPCSG